jgi:hypothetical protein
MSGAEPLLARYSVENIAREREPQQDEHSASCLRVRERPPGGGGTDDPADGQ